MRYRVNADTVERPCIGFGIRRIDGVHVTGVNNREQGMIPRRLEGEGSFDYVVDRLPLLPATYELSYAIQDEWSTHTTTGGRTRAASRSPPRSCTRRKAWSRSSAAGSRSTPAGVRRDPEPGALERRRRANVSAGD